MLLHKTPQKHRSTYTYQFFDENGNPEPTITIRPGKDGVTELDIKRLHAADDSEVYYNLKAINPVMSLTEPEKKQLRAKKAAWAEQFIREFEMQHGYTPNELEVADAVKNQFGKNWVGSLDALAQGDDEDESNTFDPKSSIFASPTEEEVAAPVARMREIVAGLSPNHQGVYQLVIIQGRTKVEAASILHISDTRVGKIARELNEIFANDEILKKFFR